MAKKLNKKVVIFGAAFLTLCIIGGTVLTVAYLSRRNPDRNLELARQALAEEDYKAAERYFGRAYAYGKTDAWKVERLFEMADFHLIHNELHEVNWPKALSCWNTVLNIDPQNIPARRNMMHYFYAMANSGVWTAWRNVYDNASELIAISDSEGIDVEPELLRANGRAALAIAQRGGTADRDEYLTRAIEALETLVEREPTVADHYGYLADALTLRGELNAQAGFINARQRAQQESLEKLDLAVQLADNKAAALAARYSRELQAAGGEPNKIESLRAELEAHLNAVEPDAKLLTVLSQAYEIPGNASAEAELNRAIEAVRRAVRLAPDEFEYSYRLAMLLYRKGAAFADDAAMEDAVALAEEMQSMSQTQTIPGPEQGRNMAYRNALNVFLSRCYLEKAIDRPEQARQWIANAEPLVSRITQYFGSSEHMTAQQWEGILALAKGERDRAVRLLHRAYEQAKALDAPDQPSNIDPILCIVLARIAKEDNQIGLQREFLEKALSNRSRVVLDRPHLILEYAELMARLRAWNRAVPFAQTYQMRYGANARSQKILTDAALALGQNEQVMETIAALPEQSIERMELELKLVSSQIAQSIRQIAQLELDQQQPSDELYKNRDALSARQKQLFFEVIDAAPEKIDVQALRAACVHYLQNEKTDQAIALLDAYLARKPDTPILKVLRLQADEPDPTALRSQRFFELQLKAVGELADPKERAMSKASLYRSQGDLDKASEWLKAAADADSENDDDVIEERFYIAIDREDVNKAEELWRIMRTRNLDGVEGNLAAAQVELLKNNHSLALRRVDEALAIKPLISYGYYLKSRIYQEMENLDAAVENSRQAVHMNPLNSLYSKNFASILFNRNNALGMRVSTEQKNELLQAITTAILLNPNDWQLQSVYAEIVSDQSPDRALAIRQQLLQNHPTPANAVMLGNMALRMARAERDVAKRSGLIELSGRAFTQAFTMDPDNEAAKAAYADYLRQTQQSEKAEELLRDDKNLLWRYYLQNNQHDKAEELLKELHQAAPEDVHILRGLVLAAEGAGNRAEQKEHLDLLATLDHDKDGELWIIQKYMDSGHIDDANRKLASFKERHPDEKLVLLMEAWSKMSDGLLSEALALTNRYLETDGDNPGAWRLRGRIYRLMNDHRRAVDDLQRSKSLAPSPAVSMELATIYSEMQQIDAAIGELVSGMQGAQVPFQMRLMLESIYKNNNRLSDLERYYNQTIEQFPQAPFWPMRAGQFYLSGNEPARAVPYLKRTWDILRRHGAMDPTALNLYLDALVQSRRYEDVFAVASEMVDGPLAPIAYTHMAHMQFRQGQSDRAESLFTTALDRSGAVDLFQDTVLAMILKTVGQDTAARWAQKNPNSLPNILLSYRLALHNEQFNRGIELINMCLDAAEPESPAWNNLALKKANLLVQAYAKTADRDYMHRAIGLFEQIIERHPDNASILNNMAYLMAINDENIDQAVQYARRAHQREPGNPTFLDTYAYAQYKDGQYEPARRNLLRAIQLFDVTREPIPWDVYNHLGMVYEALGETAQAIDNFNKALNAATRVPEKERVIIQERINKLQQQETAAM